MAAGKYNIIIEQGSTFEKIITLKDSAGVAINLTGCSVAAQVREKISSSTALFSFTCAITDAVNGKIKISLTKSQTTELTFKTAIYDLELTYPSTITKRILEGSVVLSKEVTK